MKMPALILVAVTALLPASPASPQAVAADPPAKDQAEASAQKVKDLQKERIATLQELVDVLTKLAQASRVEVGEATQARVLLLRAELDAAEKGADRVALYEKAVDSLRKYEELARAQVAAGRATEAAVLKVKARRLEAEIELEQAKAKDAKDRK